MRGPVTLFRDLCRICFESDSPTNVSEGKGTVIGCWGSPESLMKGKQWTVLWIPWGRSQGPPLSCSRTVRPCLPLASTSSICEEASGLGFSTGSQANAQILQGKSGYGNAKQKLWSKLWASVKVQPWNLGHSSPQFLSLWFEKFGMPLGAWLKFPLLLGFPPLSAFLHSFWSEPTPETIRDRIIIASGAEPLHTFLRRGWLPY